jgi:iron complex outermembrane receptor protein
MKTFHSFSLSLFLASLAGAQTAPAPKGPHQHENPLHLENFVVTASPLARAPDEISTPTSVLAGPALTQRLQSSLGETLAGIPGIDSTYFGPGASRPVIRGLGGDRIRMLTGGVGTIDASVVSPDHAVSLDPLLVDRIEIVRGPAALLYGGGAVGGVVNVIDGRIPETLPPGPLAGRLEARGDTASRERAGAAVLTGARDRIAWRVDAFRRETDDLRIPGYAGTDALRAEEAAEHGETLEEHDAELIRGRLPNSSTKTDGASAGLSYIGASGHLGFAYNGYNSLYGVPGHDHGDEGVRIDLRQRRLDVHGEWLAESGFVRAAKFQLGVANYRHVELEGAEIGTRFDNDGYEGRLELVHVRAGPFEGALGLQASRSDFRAAGAEAFLPPSVTRNLGLFLYEEAPGDTVTWQFGARVERQKITADGPGAVGRSHTPVTLTAGAIWKLPADLSLAVALSANERAPNAQELFADGPHAGTGAYELGDPSLGLERSTGIDLSLRRRAGHITGEIGVFLNRFNGYIFEAATGANESGLPVFAFRQRDARFYGGEAEITVHLHETEHTTADIRFFVDTVRGTNTTDDAPLPRITPVRFGAAFDWRNGPWSLAAEWRHIRRQDRIAPSETATGGYNLASASASRRFVFGRNQLEAFVRGTNLLDETARVHASFLKDIAPLPGRSLTAGLRLTF